MHYMTMLLFIVLCSIYSSDLECSNVLVCFFHECTYSNIYNIQHVCMPAYRITRVAINRCYANSRRTFLEQQSGKEEFVEQQSSVRNTDHAKKG